MKYYVPVVQVPIDMTTLGEMLVREKSETEKIYSTRVEKSVVLEPSIPARFRWPNIYDTIYFLIYESLEGGMPSSWANELAEYVANEIAYIQEAMTQSHVSHEAFMHDPSGLMSMLQFIIEDLIRHCFMEYMGDDRDLKEDLLLERMKWCLARYNQYLLEIIYEQWDVSVPERGGVICDDMFRFNKYVH
ncbi:MAG: hypothetical protein U5N10_17445 [Gemmobacter sp.]|nr:hypothetical protein [Gemmobacter sp.]